MENEIKVLGKLINSISFYEQEIKMRFEKLEKNALTQTDKENIKALIFGDANINEAEFESLKIKLGIE